MDRLPLSRSHRLSPPDGRDGIASSGTIVAFSFALGVSNVALPLAALRAGYGLSEIGALTSISAVAQFLVRATISRAARCLADRVLVSVACALLVLCCGVLVMSTGPAAFVIAQVSYGAARGYFWSASQLHAVRRETSSRRALARINLISSFGMLAGPIAAGGLSERSSDSALILAALVASAGAGLSFLMMRLPLLEPSRAGHDRTVWKRADIRATGWGSASTGAWTAMLVSFVPVVLAAEHSGLVVGVLVAMANGSSIVGSYVVGRAAHRLLEALFRMSAVAIGVGVAVLPFAGANAPLSALLLVISGLGAGALLTLSPALAIDAVHREKRAEALAVTGSFRAGALLVAPLAVAGAVAFVPLSAALAAVGSAITLVAAKRPPRPLAEEDLRLPLERAAGE